MKQPLIEFQNITNDDLNFKTTTVQTLYASYFFLQDIRIEHQRNAKNIGDVLALAGGMWQIIFQSFAIIGVFVNQRLLIGKYIRNLYIVSGN